MPFLGSVGSFFTGAAVKLAMILGIVLAVGGALLGARNSGRAIERADGLKRQLEATRSRDETDSADARLDDAAIHDRLFSRWTRR